MNSTKVPAVKRLAAVGMMLMVLAGLSVTASPQDFDFNRLASKVRSFTVIVDLQVEISFGIHTSEQSDRFLGTIVSEDGLIIFDGSALSDNAGFASVSGFTVKTKPIHVEVATLDGDTYTAEYIGVERFSRVGFVQVTSKGAAFNPVRFKQSPDVNVGDWLALYMLLPEFISPSLAADVGMVSALIESPDDFPLTVGFNSLQMTSVLFDENLEPVGVLGTLMDPNSASTDAGGLLESFGQFGIPLLGVIGADRLERMIDEPPRQGEIDRGWLGITLQALTKDMAEFWGLDLPGGIVVNNVVKGSPAEQAGLEVGDIIAAVNEQPITIDKEENIPAFQRLVAQMGPGASVDMLVIRRHDETDDTLMLRADLGEAPIAAADAEEYESDLLELTVRNMVFADYMINNLDVDRFDGVVVSNLKMGGPAQVGGLRIGDIIQRIDDTEIESIQEAGEALAAIEAEQPSEVIFFVWRQNKTLFVNVKID